MEPGGKMSITEGDEAQKQPREPKENCLGIFALSQDSLEGMAAPRQHRGGWEGQRQDLS